MLVRLERCEWIIVGRGLALLIACIVFGSIVVEIQLNQLTYWQEFVQVFNIRQVAQGAYLAYVLGAEYYLQVAWQVGSISNTSQSLHLHLMGLNLNLTTKLEFDPSPAVAYAKVNWQQMIESAFQFKHTVNQMWLRVEPQWHIFLQHVVDFIR